MRIVRRGNSVTGYRATHNSTTGGPNAWTQIGQPQTIIMTTPVWVGFYVNNASGATGTQNTCTFTNLSITPLNKAPVISATASDNVTPATLIGTITDDDLPAAFTSQWSQRSGPSVLSFENALASTTSASFTSQGSYGLRLVADDTGTMSFFDFSFMGYLTPWNAWQGAQFAGGTSDPSASMLLDPDNDGMNNLLEYALGTDPKTNAPSSIVQDTTTVSSQRYLRISLAKNPAATDVTYEVQATSDLMNSASWSSAGLIIETNTASQLVVRDNVAISSGVPRFMRVRVSR